MRIKKLPIFATIAPLMIALFLSGCTAMMVGGANSGGYEPPKDDCAGERGPDGTCKDG